MMWKQYKFGVVLASLLLVMLAASANAENETAGTIKGRVNYCAQGGYVAMQVFIPGRQFTALLGQDGNFVFTGVPAGTFSINYVIGGKLVHETANVVVEGGKTADLGEVAFCDTGDAAKAEAQPQPQPQSQPQTVAGDQTADKAEPLTLKDCTSSVDKVFDLEIPNGMGACNPGGTLKVKSCNKGFADCDKNTANGCEIDIYNDNENCGRCFNQCARFEVCKLGIC